MKLLIVLLVVLGGVWLWKRGRDRRLQDKAPSRDPTKALPMVRSMGTSDFPNILASTIGRTLRAAYEMAPRTFTGWARMSTAPDFRQVARTQLSEMTKLQSVNEGGEYKMLTFGDAAEKYALAKYGGIVSLTWETIINDDLSAFDRLPRAIAEEAAATEGDIVYGILTTNAAMSDTVALFDAAHGNLAGSGTAISDSSLGVARVEHRQLAARGAQLVQQRAAVARQQPGRADGVHQQPHLHAGAGGA